MRTRLALALALAATLSLPSPGRAQEADGLSGLVAPETLEGLGAPQRATLAKVLGDEFCYCGCPHTLAGCLREHKSCRHAPRMAALAARLARAGLSSLEILKLLTTYYSSFDAPKRARLDVQGYGPPLGDPGAPVVLVEFSDFTCPYCQALRPRLEAFVKARSSRVRLYYKPFPIVGHDHAAEAAEAAEWARERGLFWKMHDALFETPHALSPDGLEAAAARIGADPADLRRALEARRYRARVEASQTEGRSAGVTGTPTLFVNGRRHLLDWSEEALDFTLEDEEEWARSGGWARD